MIISMEHLPCGVLNDNIDDVVYCRVQSISFLFLKTKVARISSGWRINAFMKNKNPHKLWLWYVDNMLIVWKLGKGALRQFLQDSNNLQYTRSIDFRNTLTGVRPTTDWTFRQPYHLNHRGVPDFENNDEKKETNTKVMILSWISYQYQIGTVFKVVKTLQSIVTKTKPDSCDTSRNCIYYIHVDPCRNQESTRISNKST